LVVCVETERSLDHVLVFCQSLEQKGVRGNYRVFKKCAWGHKVDAELLRVVGKLQIHTVLALRLTEVDHVWNGFVARNGDFFVSAQSQVHRLAVLVERASEFETLEGDLQVEGH
jgi:hypothetical protein